MMSGFAKTFGIYDELLVITCSILLIATALGYRYVGFVIPVVYVGVIGGIVIAPLLHALNEHLVRNHRRLYHQIYGTLGIMLIVIPFVLMIACAVKAGILTSYWFWYKQPIRLTFLLLANVLMMAAGGALIASAAKNN